MQVTRLKMTNATLMDLVQLHTGTIPSDLSHRTTKLSIEGRVAHYIELFINECGSQQMAVNFSEQITGQLKVYMIIIMIQLSTFSSNTIYVLTDS